MKDLFIDNFKGGMLVAIGIPLRPNVKYALALVCTWMGDRSGMSISADSPSDETLNRGPLALLLRRQYEFLFGINIVQFSFFFFLDQKVRSSIPGSNSLCSCHSLQRGGAVAMVTELALSLLWRHSW